MSEWKVTQGPDRSALDHAWHCGVNDAWGGLPSNAEAGPQECRHYYEAGYQRGLRTAEQDRQRHLVQLAGCVLNRPSFTGSPEEAAAEAQQTYEALTSGAEDRDGAT